MNFSFCKTWMQRALRVTSAFGVSAVLLACGGGGTTQSTTSYTVGGSLSGLASGQSVSIAGASGVSATFSANGNYTFVAAVPDGATYNLSISAQPNGQICSISNASGTVSGVGVNNVAVSCGNTLNTTSYAVGGSLSGLASGQSVSIAGASGASVTFSANGNYTFVVAVPDGATYSLSVSAQPIGQICSISNPSGTVRGAGINNVAVSCANTLNLLAGNIGSSGSIDGTGASARFEGPQSLATDSAGNVYVADSDNHTIRKITPAGVVSTLAGSAGDRGSVDGTGTAASFNFPYGLATDSSGNVYVADTDNHTIRKITPAGVVSTLAGSAGNSGSVNGTGTAARFDSPRSLATDATGNVYVVDTNDNTIRKITPAGVVSTLAGSAGVSGSVDGTGTAARFNLPQGIATDSAGNVYVADTGNHTIRKITLAGVVSTLVGSAGSTGSIDGTGTAARFNSPRGLAPDSAGNVYVADTDNHTIRKITPAGVVSTLAGSAGVSGSDDGTGTAARFDTPFGLATDAAGNVYVADTNNHTIRKITPAGMVSTLAGSAGASGSVDGTGTAARFNSPRSLTTDAAGNVYVADSNNHTIRKITPVGVVSTLAGSAGSTGSVDGTGTAARFNFPYGLATDSVGNVYVADTGNHTIRKITPAGVVSTLAGSAGNTGSADGTGTAARFDTPFGLATDAAGNVYVADSNNHTIRKITPAGVVSTLAGSAGTTGSVDGTGTAARFYIPGAIATDAVGNVYVADSFSHTIRKITPTGVVSTLAGSGGNTGSIDGTGAAARFDVPRGLSPDSAGNLYVADSDNDTIRKITPAGVVSTIIGRAGIKGVSLAQLPASLATPSAVSVAGGKLYITTANAVVWAYIP